MTATARKNKGQHKEFEMANLLLKFTVRSKIPNISTNKSSRNLKNDVPRVNVTYAVDLFCKNENDNNNRMSRITHISILYQVIV